MGEEYLRLDSKFTSVAAFWKPEVPDAVMTGTLIVDDDGIRFVTSPEYFRGANVPRLDLSRWNSDSVPRSDVLQGFFEGGNCTLLNLMEIQYPGLTSYKDEPQSVAATAHRASIFVSGMRTGAVDDKCLDSARYTFSSLSQFVNVPFTERWDGDGPITIEIQSGTKQLLDCSVLETHVHVELKTYQTLTTDEEREARLIKTVAMVEVTPPEAESMSWFITVGDRLENLFSLLAGTSLAMETFFIYREGTSGAVIWKQHAFEEKYEPLYSLRLTNSQLAHALSTWFSESEGFREIENLLLGVLRKGKLFVETEFLSLAQALEGFHRATGGDESKLDKRSFKDLCGKIKTFLDEQNVDDETAKRVNTAVAYCNQTSFRSRLKELCARISPSTLGNMKIDIDAFAASVTNTRNFFTHAGRSSDETKELLRGGDLFLLNQKMRALLRGVFLLHLGFPESQFKELIVREATRWR